MTLEFTQSQVARMLGVRHFALQVAIEKGRFPPPHETSHGKVWLWSEIQPLVESRTWLTGDPIGTKHGNPKKVVPVAESLQKVPSVFET